MIRERSTGSYRVGPYFLAKSTSDIGLYTVAPILYATAVYWCVGLRAEAGVFFKFLLLFMGQVSPRSAGGGGGSGSVWGRGGGIFLLLEVCTYPCVGGGCPPAPQKAEEARRLFSGFARRARCSGEAERGRGPLESSRGSDRALAITVGRRREGQGLGRVGGRPFISRGGVVCAWGVCTSTSESRLSERTGCSPLPPLPARPTASRSAVMLPGVLLRL